MRWCPWGWASSSLPSSVFGGENPNTTAQAIALSIGLVIVAAIGLPVLIQQWSRQRNGAGAVSPRNEFVYVFGPVYLVVLGILWASALPAYFGAVDGITTDGTPTGNLLYAAACFAIATLAVVAVATASASRRSVAVDENALPLAPGRRRRHDLIWCIAAEPLER